MYSLDVKLGKEWICLFLLHHELYIKTLIVLILVDLE